MTRALGDRRRAVLLSAGVLLLAGTALVLPATSGGRYAPRDGFWGGMGSTIACFIGADCGRTSETAYFKLRSRTVKEVGYNVVVACYNRETRESYDRYFTVNRANVQARLDSNGVARFSRQQSSDGRSGSADVTIDFSRSRPLMKIRLDVSGRVERCNGLTTLPVRTSRG
ncbi:MAG: hypothetical protein ACKOGM_04625 [Solirubrobacterales bacterium]